MIDIIDDRTYRCGHNYEPHECPYTKCLLKNAIYQIKEIRKKAYEIVSLKLKDCGGLEARNACMHIMDEIKNIQLSNDKILIIAPRVIIHDKFNHLIGEIIPVGDEWITIFAIEGHQWAVDLIKSHESEKWCGEGI